MVAEWFRLLCVEQDIAGSSLTILNSIFFSILKSFPSSRGMSVHNGIPHTHTQDLLVSQEVRQEVRSYDKNPPNYLRNPLTFTKSSKIVRELSFPAFL